MAAWIELHQTLVTHRKLYALADALKVDRMQAMGHLIALWLWAIDQAEDGNLSEFPAAAIAEAARWRKSPELLRTALIRTGWIDDNGGGHSEIHDWNIYAGRLMEKRVKDRERKRNIQTNSSGKAAEIPRNIQADSDGKVAEFHRRSQVTEPYRTNKN